MFLLNSKNKYLTVPFVFQVFVGNADSNSVVRHKLHDLVEARYLRFLPLTWASHVCMRVEAYGCEASYGRS